MFIITEKLPTDLSRELSLMLKMLKKTFGAIPPHFRLLGTIDHEKLQETLSSLFKLMYHKRINPDLFTYIRFHIANKEGYKYCINFNHNLLKSNGYSEEIIANTIRNISTIPLKPEEQVLAAKGIKAIYHPSDFNKTDLLELYKLGWNDKDIYDVIDHAGFILKNGRIISCYLK